MKELDLLGKKDLREKVIGRTEVLDKVGDLLLLPNTEYGTIKQVADYYKVSERWIKELNQTNSDEIESDGYRVYKKNEIIGFLKGSLVHLRNEKGKSIVTLNNDKKLEVPNRGLRLFPKRAILRVGMLLRGSEIAKEIRTRLLDVIHDVEKESPEIIQNVVNEISEEKQLMLERVEAEMNGDSGMVSVINAKLFALKNKRIKELEDINEKIMTHSLTIMESRNVINRIVRTIAMREYNSIFGKAYSDLYSKINYKLGINIKNRKKKKSYLDTLTEEETFKVEEIVRNWAAKLGLNLDSLLKIA